VQFRFNYWNRDFFDALEGRDAARLRTQALLLVPLCGASVALAVTSVWGRMTVQAQVARVADHPSDRLLGGRRYARLAQIQCEQQIPEYRIAQDVRIVTGAPIDFALGLVSSLLTAIIQVLWNVGGDAAFSLFDYRL